MSEPIKIKILAKKPTGYLVEMIERQQQMHIPRLAFERRLDVGLYEVVNPEFLSPAISDY